MESPVLHIHDLDFSWQASESFRLHIPDLKLSAGEKLLLIGESGTGKSTLLSLVCGIVEAGSGDVVLNGQSLDELAPSQRDQYRAAQIGIIFQQFNLLPFATVLDNILLPLQFAPGRRSKTKEARSEAARLCSALGLPEEVLGRRANSLSVGQQQRVAAARALIGRPPLIVADEPTSALDEGSQSAFLDLLFDQLDGSGSSLLMVSHDTRLAPKFDRVLKMSDIARVGEPAL